MSEAQKVQEPSPKADCYSDGERHWMEKYQVFRSKLIKPILVSLTSLHVTADVVTFVAGIIGLLFVPLWLLSYQVAALACLLLHLLLDGIDGSLARHQNLASSRGSFTDTVVDQLVVTCVTITWLVTATTTANIAAATAYVFLYAVVVGLAMARNAMSVPYSFVVRPRFFVYIAIAADYWFAIESTFYVLMIANLLLGFLAFTGCYVLRQHLPGPNQ